MGGLRIRNHLTAMELRTVAVANALDGMGLTCPLQYLRAIRSETAGFRESISEFRRSQLEFSRMVAGLRRD